jgi:hypothetical protein
MAIQYKIASGKPTRKWKASAAAGSAALPLNILIAYVVGQALPDVPGEVRAALVLCLIAALSWATTQGAALLAGYLARPAASDSPVVDEAASKRPVEPLAD